jgi:hypothetical protein
MELSPVDPVVAGSSPVALAYKCKSRNKLRLLSFSGSAIYPPAPTKAHQFRGSPRQSASFPGSPARGGRGCATNLRSCATKVRDGLCAFGCLHPFCPSGHSLPQLPGLIRLPDPPPTFDLQGGQPAPAVAEGVDALEVAQVQKLPVLLQRVADDGDLAGTVALGDRRQRGPAQATPLLLVQGQVPVVVGVDENVADGFVVVPAPLDELQASGPASAWPGPGESAARRARQSFQPWIVARSWPVVRSSNKISRWCSPRLVGG